MSDYRKMINTLKHEGVLHRTFINDAGEMVIRYNECGEDYTEDIFNGVGKLVKIIDVQEDSVYIQEAI